MALIKGVPVKITLTAFIPLPDNKLDSINTAIAKAKDMVSFMTDLVEDSPFDMNIDVTDMTIVSRREPPAPTQPTNGTDGTDGTDGTEGAEG